MGAEARFRAMGSDVHVVLVGEDRTGLAVALDAARLRIEDLESRWSRFLPTSEVSLLNTMAGLPVRVSPETVLLVQRSLDGVRRTGGRFDPTVLGDVVRAGYDRSFELLAPDAGPVEDGRERGADGIEVDAPTGTVRLPDGVGFDPGGIGKGLAADLVAAEARSAGVAGACVNIGGDLRVSGQGPDGGDWPVAIADPFDRADVATVVLRDGAVATSTRVRRVLSGGHHLIDPATGAPADGGVASATVVAAAGWLAEVLAKAAFVAGPVEGPALVERAGADGLLILDDGSVVRTRGLHRFEPATNAAAAGGPGP